MPRFQCIHHTHSRTRTHHPAPNSLGLAPADRLLSLPPSARYTCCPGRWEWYEVALQRFPHSSSWGGGPPAWCLDSSIPPAQSSNQPDCRRGTYCTAQYCTKRKGGFQPRVHHCSAERHGTSGHVPPHPGQSAPSTGGEGPVQYLLYLQHVHHCTLPSLAPAPAAGPFGCRLSVSVPSITSTLCLFLPVRLPSCASFRRLQLPCSASCRPPSS